MAQTCRRSGERRAARRMGVGGAICGGTQSPAGTSAANAGHGNRDRDAGRQRTGYAVPHGGAERGAGQIVLRRLAGAVGVVRAQHGERASRGAARSARTPANSVCSATA